MQNLLPDIISFIKSKETFNSFWNNIFAPDFIEDDTKNQTPSLAIKQIWGNKSWQSIYSFIIRASSLITSRELATTLINSIEWQFNNSNVKWQELSSGIFDNVSNIAGYKQSSFSITFFDYDAL